jgi:hypothetical protein
MDPSSQNVIAFLSQAQHSMSRLKELSEQLTSQGAKPEAPTISLSGSPVRIRANDPSRSFDGCIAFVLPVMTADGKDYELGVDVFWDETGWTLLTEYAVEGADDWELLHAWPERQADELDSALDHLRAAVEDLFAAGSLFGFEPPSSI